MTHAINTPEQRKAAKLTDAQNAGCDVAIKYWTCTDAESKIAAEIRKAHKIDPAKFGQVVTTKLDGPDGGDLRYYCPDTWADHRNDDLKRYAAHLRNAGLKFHAIAFLCDIRPRLASPAAKAGFALLAEDAKTTKAA